MLVFCSGRIRQIARYVKKACPASEDCLMKRIACYISFLFICFFAQKTFAQEEFIDPPSRLITKVPFTQLTGGVIIIKAMLNDFPDSLNFILDTGSSGISLDSGTAEYLKLKPTPTDKTIRGIAGIKQVSFLYNQKLKLPGLIVDSLNFHINDYSLLTSVYGEQIDGIIGYSLINRYILKIDNDSLNLSVCTKGPLRYPRGGYLLKPSINRLVAQDIRVKDNRTIYTKQLFDIGAGLCMIFSKEFIQDSSLFDRKKKVWIKQAEGIGGKVDMELSVLKEVKIGPYKFRKVPVFIFDDENNITSYPYMGGILGNDIMRRFNVILNYGAGDIHIIPNKHYNDLFDYSYVGLELYLINGIIIVGDVAVGSPAEAAGIFEGDQVVAVNKNFTQNLNQYKLAMQVPNEKIKLILRRNDVLIEKEFKVKSIY
jgi:Aspartyl protease/PDZ domain